jgi:hypothetical protein
LPPAALRQRPAVLAVDGLRHLGRNNFSDNLNYRHYLNIARVDDDPEVVPTDDGARRVLRATGAVNNR